MDTFARPRSPAEELAALEEHRAFLDLSFYRKFEVTGPDARTWLHDLLTAAIAPLREGSACRALLLSATGRIRADVHVVSVSDGLLLLQDPLQPSIGDLLGPYVLSSAVTITDRTDELRLYAVPGRRAGLGGRPGIRPSVIGEGEDLIAPTADAAGLESMLRERLTEAGREASEVWRIRRGVARFPVDLAEDSVPAEGGLEHLIDVEKGCFPGQESVAKIRNLGHPSRVIRALRSEAELRVGLEVVADHEAVGRVTSAAPAAEGGTACLARIRWAAAERPLATRDGVPLTPVDPSA